MDSRKLKASGAWMSRRYATGSCQLSVLVAKEAGTLKLVAAQMHLSDCSSICKWEPDAHHSAKASHAPNANLWYTVSKQFSSIWLALQHIQQCWQDLRHESPTEEGVCCTLFTRIKTPSCRLLAQPCSDCITRALKVQACAEIPG